MKFCKDCVHYNYMGFYLAECSQGTKGITNPVTGKMIDDKDHCYFKRSHNGLCGPDGRFFEQRESTKDRVYRLLNKYIWGE